MIEKVWRERNFLRLCYDAFPLCKIWFKEVVAEYGWNKIVPWLFCFCKFNFFLGFKVVLRMERDNFVSSLVVNSW